MHAQVQVLPGMACSTSVPACMHRFRDGMRHWHACMRRFKYSQEFLQWALQPPGWQSEWVLGVRVSTNGKLVAFITGGGPSLVCPQTQASSC